MVIDRVRHRILRIALSMSVIIDYQVSREPHKPVRQISLLGVVLVERSVDSDEDLLCQVFGRVWIGCKSVCEIKYPSRERLHDLFPRQAIARPRPSHEFRTVRFYCSL